MQKKAELFCRVAQKHGECLATEIINSDESAAQIKLEFNVQMPFQYRVDGESPNGVRKTEIVIAYLTKRFPWATPIFTLRMDFPRDLPHLQPGNITKFPEPCLIDGAPREFFFQFGLAEVGIFHLIDQLAIWLRKAATSSLIDYSQGWEPTMRQNLNHLLSLDIEAYQNTVARKPGWKVFGTDFYRSGQKTDTINKDLSILLEAGSEQVPLRNDINDKQISISHQSDNGMLGQTVTCLIWPGADAGGKPIISSTYTPETVTTMGELKEKAAELCCLEQLEIFLNNIERYFNSYILKLPIPVGIVLAVRRPCHLIGSKSDIELIPYVFEINASPERTGLLANGNNEPVGPCQALAEANPQLMRNVSGTLELPALAMIGAGSVGSKLALHFAKSGIGVKSISDSGILRPHNSARHGLVQKRLSGNKAKALADEIGALGQTPEVYENDLVLGCENKKNRNAILPKSASFAVNSTASLAVREALANLDPKASKQRQIEAALFGRGEGAYLLTEGADRNPNVNDLIGELYSNTSSLRQTELLFDEKYGLTQIQIGLGCGSLTMPMTDARLSNMTGGLAEEVQRIIAAPPEHGEMVVAIKEENSPSAQWTRQSVPPFTIAPIEGVEDWQIRVSPNVLQKMRVEQAKYPDVETGGVMIGLCSARLQAITVVDLLPAPPDSTRTASKFVLGTQSLKTSIENRFRDSGGSLVDVGTWHTHMTDIGPSQLDRETAHDLAKDRTPPSCLFIVTPNQFHAFMEASDG